MTSSRKLEIHTSRSVTADCLDRFVTSTVPPSDPRHTGRDGQSNDIGGLWILKVGLTTHRLDFELINSLIKGQDHAGPSGSFPASLIKILVLQHDVNSQVSAACQSPWQPQDESVPCALVDEDIVSLGPGD
ncbi:hypothetical protein EYF80_030145 [Liparis tanakae]|uniref:Uncharacterized protein n=1 Tax=Liparis tanakae TaxID=230148 RepID=A0A4Z2H1L1_9TELE|nr:hypothetical protein EYF80_030145 [Liparis tanakae]